MKKLFLASAAAFLFVVSVDAASAQGLDPYNRGPLNIFRRDRAICGRGWEFPILYWGDRPTSVCMLRPRRGGAFGGDLF